MTKENKVYEFEKNLKTLLEFNKNVEIFIESKILDELCFKQIIDFKYGWNYAIARAIDGKVYFWGWNEWGVLGNRKNDSNLEYEKIYKPELNEYLINKQIIDICCGYSHSLVLTNSGEVYAWGWNVWGQIGNGRSGENECQLIPIKVNGFNNEKVVMISYGFWYSTALTESGRVFSWGNNSYGQLGLNTPDDCIEKPSVMLLSNELSIKKISCGRNHCLLLTSDENIYWFGFNWIEKQKTPKKLLMNENKFIDIASHFDYFISIALSMNGIYYVWSECGEELIKEPKETEFKSFDEIFNHYFGISFCTIERFVCFKFKFIENGKYLTKYKEIEKLGEGYYGQVFRVRDHRDIECALKKIKFTIDKENQLFRVAKFCYFS